MPIFKRFIEIQGSLYDLWDLKKIDPAEVYNDKICAIEYQIVINRDAISKEYRDVVHKYKSKKLRDLDLERIRNTILDNETTELIPDDSYIPVGDRDYDETDDLDDWDGEEVENIENEK